VCGAGSITAQGDPLSCGGFGGLAGQGAVGLAQIGETGELRGGVTASYRHGEHPGNVAVMVVVALGSGWLGGCTLARSIEPPPRPPESARVTSVELVSSGGEGGVMITQEVSAQGRPPKGMSVAGARDVLRIASSPEFRSLTLEKVPSGHCCDFLHYSVTVRYSDGSTLRYETAERLDRPEPLTRLIAGFG